MKGAGSKGRRFERSTENVLKNFLFSVPAGFQCDTPDNIFATMNELRDQSNAIASELQGLKNQLDGQSRSKLK